VATDSHVAEFTAPLLLLIAAITAILWRRWLLMAQMPAAATLAGLRVPRWDALFLVLLCGAVLLSTNALGVVMVLAILFLPAATVLPFTRRIPPAMLLSMIIAIATYAIGFVVSNKMDWPQSQSVGGVGFAILVLTHLAARVVRRRG
jgi:ABC-type Mn2+/Zn2+ transport system permease subunit